MPVTTQTPVITYTANGSVTSFAYPFRIIKATDLFVYEDGIEITAGFTISGVNDPAGGNVVFTVAPTNGKVIRLQRITSLDRSTDYTEGGALAADVLDSDIDRVVMMVQDINNAPMLETADGTFDAENKRIKNVATPVNASDAVNKAYVDTNVPALVAQAEAAATAADASELDAENAAIAAAASAVAAAASAATIPAYPTLVGNELKIPRLNGAGTEMEFRSGAQVLTDIGASATGHLHAGIYEPIDANIVRINSAQSFTAPQRGTATTDNDLSFDLSVANNFTCTPSAGGTLTFTNLTAGQSGSIILVNGSNYAIAKASLVKTDASFLTKISASGTYRLSYYSDGTNVYVTTSGALS